VLRVYYEVLGKILLKERIKKLTLESDPGMRGVLSLNYKRHGV